MVASASDGIGLQLAPPQGYRLPQELARHLWRVSCRIDEERPEDGASESGLMEVAWELFLQLSNEQMVAYLKRTFAARKVVCSYKRATYSLPQDLVRRVKTRLNQLHERALDQREKPPFLAEFAEAALIHFTELPPKEQTRVADVYKVCRKRGG